jgi:hypothetical protein
MAFPLLILFAAFVIRVLGIFPNCRGSQAAKRQNWQRFHLTEL